MNFWTTPVTPLPTPRLLKHDGKRRRADSAALLECADGCGRWVEHTFYARQEAADGIEVLYKCTKCGALTRWGLEEPPLKKIKKTKKKTKKENIDE